MVIQRGAGILGDILNSAGQGPKGPNLTLELTVLWGCVCVFVNWIT